MALASPIPEPLAELIAERLRAIADPTRVRLLDRLRDGGRSVQDLAGEIGGSQQNVSKHLGVLLRAGIVTRTRSGTRAVYSIADMTVFDLCETVCGGIQRQLAELAALVDGGAG